MEKKNTGLIVLVIVLSLLVVALFGYLVYDKVLNKEPESNMVDNNENDNMENDTNKNGNIDSTILNKLYSIIGIQPVDQFYKNNCLNLEISQNNYRDNARSIFSWYASLNDLNTYHEDAMITEEGGVSYSVYMAAATRSISKQNASNIIILYDFDNMSDFLNEMPKPYENEYYYASYTSQPESCDYDVEHNTTSEYIGSSTIRIVDNQNVTEYNFQSEHSKDNVKTTKNQTVTYTFEKDNNGNYYLNNVNVK